MKILITIPHYYSASASGHGSGISKPQARINALSSCLFNLHALLGSSQCMIDIFNKKTIGVNQDYTHNIDVVICTTDKRHLLNELNLPKNFYAHHETTLENPKQVGWDSAHQLSL